MSITPQVVFKIFQDAIRLKPVLDRLEVFAVNCNLNKAIEKLLMVKELLKAPEKTESSGYTSPALRMKERNKFIPPEAQLPENVLLSQKVKCQISFLLDLFEETVIEFIFQGSQVYLEYTLYCENFKLFDNQMIVNENNDYNKLIHYLQEQLKNYKQTNHRTQQQSLLEPGPCLDKAAVNVYAEENLGTIYACIRELTRTEKNALTFKENERAPQQLNKTLHSEVKEETMIHQEVNSHLTLLLTELANKVEYWTNKYNTEINQLDLDLLQMKSQKDELTTALETLIKQFSEKKEMMMALQDKYDERERENEQKLVENKAAEIIQRWWKNILFKKKLLKEKRKKSSTIGVEKQKTKLKSKK